MNPHKSLRSFYGASDRLKANTAKAHIGSGADRPQEIYTPQCIVDALGILWPEGIAFDPCSGPGSIVGADRECRGKQELNAKGKLEWVGPGLEIPWEPRTYFNPPYKDLKAWLHKALESIEACDGELVGLIPMRTSRAWFRDYLTFCTRFCLLDPLKFVGFDQAFPAPLVLTYHGDRDLDSACKGLGDCFSIS